MWVCMYISIGCVDIFVRRNDVSLFSALLLVRLTIRGLAKTTIKQMSPFKSICVYIFICSVYICVQTKPLATITTTDTILPTTAMKATTRITLEPNSLRYYTDVAVDEPPPTTVRCGKNYEAFEADSKHMILNFVIILCAAWNRISF